MREVARAAQQRGERALAVDRQATAWRTFGSAERTLLVAMIAMEFDWNGAPWKTFTWSLDCSRARVVSANR